MGHHTVEKEISSKECLERQEDMLTSPIGFHRRRDCKYLNQQYCVSSSEFCANLFALFFVQK